MSHRLRLSSAPLALCALLLLFLGASCQHHQPELKQAQAQPRPLAVESPPMPEPGPRVHPAVTNPKSDDADTPAAPPPTFTVRADEGTAGGSEAPGDAAPTSPLPGEATAQLLGRLPAIEAPPSDVQEVRIRESSQPIPQTGETLTTPFPPPASLAPPAATEVGQHETPGVARYQPEGEVPMAPRVSITFQTPMVALTSHDTLQAQGFPATLSPEIEGQWRWVGTKTLFFDPVGRAPMATQYTVTLKDDLKDAQGRPLKEGLTFTFGTPPPSLVSTAPRGNQVTTEPTILLIFDQAIDPKAVLAQTSVEVSAEGGLGTYELRLATDDDPPPADYASWERLRARLEANGQEARWVALRITEALPKNAAVTVKIAQGLPSREGPRTTPKDLTATFSTYPPFRYERQHCGYMRCGPSTPLSLTFNNSIDTDQLQPEHITIDPPLSGFEATANGRQLTLAGQTQAHTTYKVTISSKLRDTFGQTLDREVALEWQVGQGTPTLIGPDDTYAVLDPHLNPAEVMIYAHLIKRLRVRLYKVEPKDWAQYITRCKTYIWKPDQRACPGTLVYDEELTLPPNQAGLIEVPISLKPALNDGLGHVVLHIEDPDVEEADSGRTRQLLTWFQVTQLGIDSIRDSARAMIWVNDLRSGEPISGATVSLQAYAKPGQPNLRTEKELSAADTLYATYEPIPTSAQGVASFPLEPGHLPLPTMVIAERGADRAFFPIATERHHFGSSGWRGNIPTDEHRWFVYDDRKLYRPGETVTLSGLIRTVGAGPRGDITRPDRSRSVNWKVVDSQRNTLREGTLTPNAQGAFTLRFNLPDTPNLGTAVLSLSGFGSHRHTFRIEEFRRPEFEVSMIPAEGPHRVGEQATATLKASYFAGGALPNAPVRWTVQANSTAYTPPNQPGYIFGDWRPWWRPSATSPGQPVTPAPLEAYTDASGAHTLGLSFQAEDWNRPVRVTAQGTVTDVNRQPWSASASFLVHPADRYVGLKPERTVFRAKQPIRVDAIVTDLEGKRQVGVPITVRSERLEWRPQRGGHYREVAVETQTCQIQSQEEAQRCEFTPSKGGRFQLTAQIKDAEGRPHQTTASVWVEGGVRPPDRGAEAAQVTFVPSQESYVPGDVAEILIQAPFSGARGLYVISRGLIDHEVPVEFGEASTLTVKVPIEDWMLPEIELRAFLVGEAVRTDADGNPHPELPTRPASSSGTISLRVSTEKRVLNLAVKPSVEAASPGAQVSATVAVRDAAGQPVQGAQVVLLAVDEAVLALTGYVHPDPIAAFYQRRPSQLHVSHSRSALLLATLADLYSQAGNEEMAEKLRDLPRMPEETAQIRKELAFAPTGSPMEGLRGGGMVKSAPRVAQRARGPMPPPAPAPTAADGPGEAKSSPIALRTDLNPLAVFETGEVTGADGQSTISFKLPDNLTRYRLVAYAFQGDHHFGKGESQLTARLPLMLRPSAPRFLNFGDKFQLTVVVQNQTDAPLKVALAARATNAALLEEGGKIVQVPAQDRVEVRFPMAAQAAGTARIQIGASAQVSEGGVEREWADAAEVSLPVYTPATTEAFASYGEVDEGAIRQPIQPPKDAIPSFGGLDVQTSSTQVQALTDAFLHLATTPYDSSEHTASRVLAIVALKDVLRAFSAPDLPAEAEIIASVDKAIVHLQGLQGRNGGFAFWRRDHETWPFVTTHVTHALVRAKAAGFAVPPRPLRDALAYLGQIERHLDPKVYSLKTRLAIRAYALYVLHRAGQPDLKKVLALLEEAGGPQKAPLELLGWLYPSLKAARSEAEAAAIRKQLNLQISETAGAAHFVTGYDDGAYLLLHSDRRVDAIWLEALVNHEPKNPLVVKLVRGLLGQRTAGRWSSTHESSWALLALGRYFEVLEKEVPNFKANAWIGEVFAGQHAYKGRTTERQSFTVPMQTLHELGEVSDLTLQKAGQGRLYYRMGLRYAPKALDLKPAQHGFYVERRYEAVDDPGDVTRSEAGHYVVKAGARVKVSLLVHTEDRRNHVALVDPMPAGFEALNSALRGTEATPDRAQDRVAAIGDIGHLGRPRYVFWWSRWYQHENLRDERAEAYTTRLWQGVYSYTYYARATTLGEFVVPPAKAEEMYAPETFGRSGSDRVIVR